FVKGVGGHLIRTASRTVRRICPQQMTPDPITVLYRDGSPYRHLWLELPDRQGEMEWPFLPGHQVQAARNGRLRRAALLRRALRHGRSEFDLLWTTTTRGRPDMGGTDAARLRVLAQAVPEVHSPEDVPQRGAGACARIGRTDARPALTSHPDRHRRVPRGYRSSRRRRTARGVAGSVSRELQERRAVTRLPREPAARVQ